MAKRATKARSRARTTPAETDAARENTKNAAATPEAALSPRQAREAANKMFEEADEKGKAEIIAGAQARRSALGY